MIALTLMNVDERWWTTSTFPQSTGCAHHRDLRGPSSKWRWQTKKKQSSNGKWRSALWPWVWRHSACSLFKRRSVFLVTAYFVHHRWLGCLRRSGWLVHRVLWGKVDARAYLRMYALRSKVGFPSERHTFFIYLHDRKDIFLMYGWVRRESSTFQFFFLGIGHPMENNGGSFPLGWADTPRSEPGFPSNQCNLLSNK